MALQTGGQVSDTWTGGRHFSCQPTKGGMAGADFQQLHGKTGKTSRQAGNANQQDRLPELGRRAGSGWHQWHFFHTNPKVEVKLQKHYTHAGKQKESWGYKQPERIPNLKDLLLWHKVSLETHETVCILGAHSPNVQFGSSVSLVSLSKF